jgi:protein involved in polysaccharide export with SLBB domain
MRSLPFIMMCLTSLAAAPAALSQATDNKNAQATRAQIVEAMANAEKILASPGYSGRVKDAKRREMALLKSRLEDGDLQPGDQVSLDVAGEPTLSKVFIVGPQRTLSFPGLDDFSVRGVLRSELQDALLAHLRKYVKDPVIQVQTTIRLSFLGGIGKPGFYQVGSGMMVGDALMAAGGPNGGIDPAKTRVERAGIIIMPKESFQQALSEGKTLDQLNLRAGDEFLVGGDRIVAGSRSNRFFTTVLPIISATMSIFYLGTRVF